MTGNFEEAFKSLHDLIAFDPRDWSQNKRDAWIYGIVVGWNDTTLEELRKKFGWNVSTVETLKKHHAAMAPFNPYKK